jgi:hypothetical protein
MIHFFNSGTEKTVIVWYDKGEISIVRTIIEEINHVNVNFASVLYNFF